MLHRESIEIQTNLAILVYANSPHVVSTSVIDRRPHKSLPRKRITEMSDNLLGRKSLKLIKQGNEMLLAIDQPLTKSHNLEIILFVAMFCSQIAISRMCLNFIEREMPYPDIFSDIKVQSK